MREEGHSRDGALKKHALTSIAGLVESIAWLGRHAINERGDADDAGLGECGSVVPVVGFLLLIFIEITNYSLPFCN
jgi:hypothetical protein